jgi:uracil-DNA glycosylase family 4
VTLVGARAVIIRSYDPQSFGAQCERCPLGNKTPVPPTPAVNGKPKLVIVGMNPGRLEENRGQAFIGPAGRLLTACLNEAGFDRVEAHITNAAACYSDNDQEIKAAVACCAPRLAAELKPFLVSENPPPILALGAQAIRPLLGRAGIMKARGFVWHAAEIKSGQVRTADRRVEKTREAPGGKFFAKRLTSALDSQALITARGVFAGRVVIPSVHPSFILRGADGWLPVLRVDIDRVVRWARGPGFPLEDQGSFHKTNNPAEARRLLSKFGLLVNVDIETNGNDPMTVEMTCVGVADVGVIKKWVDGKLKRIPKSAVVILDPWHKRLTPVLRDFMKARTALTHNGPAFDEIALKRFGVRYEKYEDTLLAHFAFASDKPKSLSHVVSVYCDSSAWKVKFKQGSEEKGVAGFGVKKEDLAAYNRADVVLGSLAWIRMQNDLAPERKIYEHDKKTAILCQKMQINGIMVDVARKKALSRKMKFRAAGLLGEMRSLLNRRGFNPNRPNDIRHALFNQLKAPTYHAPLTPTGLPATGAKVLEILKGGTNRAAALADLIIRWRSANDVRAEYLDNLILDPASRVHPHWRNYGAETGRPACRSPNALNTPRMAFCPGCGNMLVDGMTHKETCKPKKRKEPQPEDQIRDVYVAAPGCVFLYFDLSQAEMRFAANLSGDAAFIKSCEGDVHAGNARVLFAKVPGALEALKDPKGAGKNLRDIAKNCGFAITYLAEADKLFGHLIEHGFEIDIETCQDAINGIRSAYWRYFQFVEENVQICRRQGFLRTAFLGRKRWLGMYPKPTTVSNFPIQSGVADVMNDRLAIIDERMPKRVKQLVYAYDAAIYEVEEKDVETMKALVGDVWAEPIAIPGGGSFMQPIELKIGTRWSDFG